MTEKPSVREIQILKAKLETIPKVWDGKTSILELRKNNFQWRQTEWIGFWFEYWCKKNLSEIMNIPYKKKVEKLGAALLEKEVIFKADLEKIFGARKWQSYEEEKLSEIDNKTKKKVKDNTKK